MSDYQKPQLFVGLESDGQIIIDPETQAIWFSELALVELSGTTQQAVNLKLQDMRHERGESYFTSKTCRIKSGKRGRPPTYYHHHLARIALFRSHTPQAHAYQDYVNDILDKFDFEGVSVNPRLAEQNPEQVQENFYKQLSPSMKKHLNQHGHTEGYQKERLDNIEARKLLSGELIRTVDGKPNFGAIMGMFHQSLTGKTKSQLLQQYDHSTKRTNAVDTLGSMVVNQMNQLMLAVRMNLESYPDDYIPDDAHIQQIKQLVSRYSDNLRKQLELLSEDTGIPIEHLGENSHKRRLL